MPADPMDLSQFDDLAPAPKAAPTQVAQVVPGQQLSGETAVPAELAKSFTVERLVDPSTLPVAKLEKAKSLAAAIDFTHSQTTMKFVEESLAPVAQISRRLLAGTKVQEMGEVGKVATAVLEGINILRLDDLKREAQEVAPKASGFFGKVLGMGKVAGSALRSFEANRKQFLTLMDHEEARARKVKGDLMVTVELLDEQSRAVRQSVSDLTIAIAAGQLALDRGREEAEHLRQVALSSQNPGDAAIALDYRRTLLLFQSRVADLRQAMVSSATLVPVIALNRQSAETRIAKLTDGLLLTLPRLMTAASQAAVQANMSRAAHETEQLEEANRKVMALAGQGAHDAAIAATKSLAADPRNIESLMALAAQTQQTMREVLDLERGVSKSHADQEQKLLEIRKDLVRGMTAVNAEGIARPLDDNHE